MTKIFVALAVGATLGCMANMASAQCNFDKPAKPPSVKSDMVRVYAPCTAPNVVSAGGIPACAPPVALSPLRSDPKKGKCSIKMKQKTESPCKSGGAAACTNVHLWLKCAGILEPDGVTPTNSGGWTLETVLRGTINDPVGGDMTLIDFPVSFGLPPASEGKLQFKGDLNTQLGELGAGALAECTNVQFEVTLAASSGPYSQSLSNMEDNG